MPLVPGKKQYYNHGIDELEGLIPIGSAAAVGTVVGKGYTATLVTTGVYKITLGKRYRKMGAGEADYQFADNTAVGSYDCKIGNRANVASATPFFQLCVINSQSGALIAPVSGDFISFRVSLSGSQLT